MPNEKASDAKVAESQTSIDLRSSELKGAVAGETNSISDFSGSVVQPLALAEVTDEVVVLMGYLVSS